MLLLAGALSLASVAAAQPSPVPMLPVTAMRASCSMLTLLGIGARLVRARKQRLTRRVEPAPTEPHG